ncbi:MAG: DNA mismatch repair protein MutS2 [Saprospiraceae bacterium]|jgi:DNA mismatch repair protein MutS2
MKIEPKDLYEKLEFDKILELLAAECLGAYGKEQIQNLPIHTELDAIMQKLLYVNEFKIASLDNDSLPIQVYPEITEDVKLLEIEDYVLSIEALQRIGNILNILKKIFDYFSKERKETYRNLYNIIAFTEFDKTLIKEIDSVIDEEGNIKPDASVELSAIRRKINGKQKELDRQFRTLIGLYRKNGWLADTVESFRNGRRVLTVPSEHKRKIRGIIHDESATGKTAYIEPEGVIDINNDIFDLEQEEKREIYRILKALSAAIRPHAHHLMTYRELLGDYDVIQSKAKLAMLMDANMPKLKDQPHFGFIHAFHPLLFLKNNNQGRKTVPFDLKLIGDNRILVLSGPNAGGKSITMKTVGLQQLMLQAGMLIPVSPEAEIGIFNKLFADIGDQQSLEDDLSTYSSRLNNMKTFLDHADHKTMVLIDEFGSGTDPKMGGAIAESILKELNHRKVFSVITTHYSNLKMVAFKTKGIINGSMTFDQETLSPTYEMKVGRPGSSYAFEIAEKSGLSKEILDYAKHKSGKNEKAVDELLVDLQKEKKELEDKLGNLSEKEKNLKRLIRNYDDLHRDLEFKRMKFKLESKEQSLQQSAHENKDMERLIREIKEEKNLEKAKELATRVRQERKRLNEDVSGLKQEIYHKPGISEVDKKPITAGDFVKLRSGGASGKVESIHKGKAIVLMGLMKMTTKVTDLIHANEPIEIRTTKSIQTDMISTSAKFESKVDLRGLRKDEALKILEDFVDKALISSVNQLQIVHGKGDGILRKAVKNKLREYKGVFDIRHPEANSGGDGVTIVEFE